MTTEKAIVEIGTPAIAPSISIAPVKAKGKKLGTPLPYLAAAGTVKTMFDKIRQAATPDRVTPDFVRTILQIKGGAGGSIPPFLKKIGMVASDGSPTDLYKLFRNSATGGSAVASAIKHGYKALGDANEYFYGLNDKELQALIVQVTGAEANSSSSKQILYTLKALKEFADFSAPPVDKEVSLLPPKVDSGQPTHEIPPAGTSRLGLNLAYTINLNLPATSDQSVFNAIFKSLKEHLLSDEN